MARKKKLAALRNVLYLQRRQVVNDGFNNMLETGPWEDVVKVAADIVSGAGREVPSGGAISSVVPYSVVVYSSPITREATANMRFVRRVNGDDREAFSILAAPMPKFMQENMLEFRCQTGAP